MATETHNLNIGGPVTAHAFNADRTMLAISKSSNTIEIYKRNGSAFVLDATLNDHDKLVTSIDWAPSSNRIVTCSQDRNANVWTYDTSKRVWKPTLVLLRINRGATMVRWSPKEDKFAVATSARLVAICYFEPENDWWISKHLKKPIKSTVLSLDWHPNNVLLATGSTDMRVRVFSAFIKDVDSKPEPTVWGSRLPFNTLCMEAAAAGWVHDVKFSPDADYVAYVTHGSTIEIARPGENGATVSRVAYSGLPMTSILFINESTFVAAGHNCSPVVFSESAGSWSEERGLDTKGGKKQEEGNAFKSLRNSFRDMDVKGGSGDTGLPTVHQNTITQVSTYHGNRGSVSQISTSGVDGKVVVWSV
ncbi:protein of unknown function [Taphrina deformans PYCC 5710]|uniref:Actin-related protein 2/3 complex subunit n=1 Tax=Taphrina deformans (strain PYCC 5710 / ATCC 11124 / CBS 356.35 / IMI 108563 / JCM 9778 / NBRC 8474) TaxID=1097556 RepID=R4XDJ6_TAPDE|nr:protein of unknown function [Taphrina deformans PYCC 5710]|eukprot:CCG83951.1 protein of unknown function [Taphrina deformans PYCC 5710]